MIEPRRSAKGEYMGPPSRRQLLQFGLLLAAVAAAIGLWPLLTPAPPRVWLLGCAAALALWSVARPQTLAPLYRGWLRLGHALGAISSRVILTTMFFVIFLPAGLVMRLLGRDPLRRRFDPELESYLDTSEPRDVSHMDNPF
ncbi:MAG: SxtJ family membrane protein [Pseudomonadota bacterium]